jgi:ECF sigma factor
MNEVTRVLSAIEQGDTHAAHQLLPLIYDELRTLAAQTFLYRLRGVTVPHRPQDATSKYVWCVWPKFVALNYRAVSSQKSHEGAP